MIADPFEATPRAIGLGNYLVRVEELHVPMGFSWGKALVSMLYI